MQGVKPWQLVVIGLGFLALIGGFVWSVRGGNQQPKLADSIVMVDVATGELFELALEDGLAFIPPVKNPDTGTESLFPAYRDEATGKWYLDERFRGALVKRLSKAEPKAVADERSGELRVTSDSPRRASAPR